jgi:hypothetical protein
MVNVAAQVDVGYQTSMFNLYAEIAEGIYSDSSVLFSSSEESLTRQQRHVFQIK